MKNYIDKVISYIIVFFTKVGESIKKFFSKTYKSTERLITGDGDVEDVSNYITYLAVVYYIGLIIGIVIALVKHAKNNANK